jgi:hypothetical protein
MARLLKRLPDEFKEMSIDKFGLWNFAPNGNDYSTTFALEKKALEALKKRAIFVWKFQMADSYAYYEVANLKPLQLVWIPYMDKWEAPDYAIRGLSTEDVEADIRWEQQFIKKEVK